MSDIKLGRYRHYKGDEYDVFGFAHHVETQVKMVLYRPLHEIPELNAQYNNDVVFVRACDIFKETTIIDGKEMPRFEYIGE